MKDAEEKPTEQIPAVAPAAPTEAEIAEWKKKAAELEETLPLYQRAVADYQNLRKRLEKDIASRSEDLVMSLVHGLLVVLDHLDMALASSRASKEKSGAFFEGVSMIRTEIQTLLAQQGVQPIPTQKAKFDPSLHEALLQESKEGVEPGIVLEEMRAGYRWRDRVVRPAQVKVSAPQKPASPENKENKNADL